MSVFEKMTTIADLIRNPLKTDEKMGLDRMAELLPEALDVKYNDGYSAGHTDGYDSGETDGLVQGEKIGYENGKNERNAIMFGILSGEINELKEEHLYGLKRVGGYMFSGNNNLLSVEIPETVTQINGCAFENCYKLNKVTLSERLEGVQIRAFNGCTALTSLTIPASVTYLGKQSLQIGSTTNKATIIFESATPPTIEANTFDASKVEKIIVPAGCGTVYRSATNWSAFADYIEEAVE